MNYEYFSGANVSIAMGAHLILECAGISFSQQESKQPIYGYSSREFDAMLLGRKLVQGTFVINYTDSRYLEKLFLGEERVTGQNPEFTSLDFNNPGLTNFDISIIYSNSSKPPNVADLRDATATAPAATTEQKITRKTITPHLGINKTDLILKNCYILSRGQTIQISDQVLLEEYNFMARRVEKVPTSQTQAATSGGDNA